MAPPKTTTKTQTQENVAGPAPTGNVPARRQAAAANDQAREKHPLVQFREYMDQRIMTLSDDLPPGIGPRKFIAVVMVALQTKPELLKCTFQSLWNACRRAAQDGLLPDGREGAIAPYGQNENGERKAEIATWMPMIAGFRKKVYEAGHVAHWHVDVVYETDEFDFDLAEQKVHYHRRKLGTTSPGGILGAYSFAKLKNGEYALEVMSAYEITQIKNISKAKNGPWGNPAFVGEMSKKVVARRHYKQLPHTESLDAMIARDDAENGFEDPEAPRIVQTERPRQALGSTQVMDRYSGDDDGGMVLDHDQVTGEVSESNDQTAGKKEDPISSGPLRGASQATAQADRAVDGAGAVVKDRAAETTNANTATGDKPAAAEGGSEGAASSPSSETRVEAPGASQGSEAGAAGAPAGGSAAPSLLEDDENQEGQGDGAQVDGADRPWPPGTTPTDGPEYDRYARTMLQSFTTPAQVPEWWNKPEEKQTRINCGLKAGSDEFKRIRDMVAKRIEDLSKATG